MVRIASLEKSLGDNVPPEVEIYWLSTGSWKALVLLVFDIVLQNVRCHRLL